MRNHGGSSTGVLIMFIAGIFVAATAALVLIQTGDAARQRALNTGGQAMHQVSAGAQILSVYGFDGSHALENLTVTIRSNGASDSIQLNGAMIRIDTGNTSTGYHYTTGTYSVNATAENGTYSVAYIQRGPNNRAGLLVRGDLVEIALETPRPLVDGERVKISFHPSTGLPTTTTFFVPDITTTQHVALYS